MSQCGLALGSARVSRSTSTVGTYIHVYMYMYVHAPRPLARATVLISLSTALLKKRCTPQKLSTVTLYMYILYYTQAHQHDSKSKVQCTMYNVQPYVGCTYCVTHKLISMAVSIRYNVQPPCWMSTTGRRLPMLPGCLHTEECYQTVCYGDERVP